jgi:hypothetical protein
MVSNLGRMPEADLSVPLRGENRIKGKSWPEGKTSHKLQRFGEKSAGKEAIPSEWISSIPGQR